MFEISSSMEPMHKIKKSLQSTSLFKICKFLADEERVASIGENREDSNESCERGQLVRVAGAGLAGDVYVDVDDVERDHQCQHAQRLHVGPEHPGQIFFT